jgi:hypothetical protein
VTALPGSSKDPIRTPCSRQITRDELDFKRSACTLLFLFTVAFAWVLRECAEYGFLPWPRALRGQLCQDSTFSEALPCLGRALVLRILLATFAFFSCLLAVDCVLWGLVTAAHGSLSDFCQVCERGTLGFVA